MSSQTALVLAFACVILFLISALWLFGIKGDQRLRYPAASAVLFLIAAVYFAGVATPSVPKAWHVECEWKAGPKP